MYINEIHSAILVTDILFLWWKIYFGRDPGVAPATNAEFQVPRSVFWDQSNPPNFCATFQVSNTFFPLHMLWLVGFFPLPMSACSVIFNTQNIWRLNILLHMESGRLCFIWCHKGIWQLLKWVTGNLCSGHDAKDSKVHGSSSVKHQHLHSFHKVGHFLAHSDVQIVLYPTLQ